MDAGDLSRSLFAFLAILGCIGGAALLARKLGLANISPSTSKQRRLKLVEAIPIDARRRLILVRCDEREHLLMLGPTGELVIDANVPPAPAPSKELSKEQASLANAVELFNRRIKSTQETANMNAA